MPQSRHQLPGASRRPPRNLSLGVLAARGVRLRRGQLELVKREPGLWREGRRVERRGRHGTPVARLEAPLVVDNVVHVGERDGRIVGGALDGARRRAIRREVRVVVRADLSQIWRGRVREGRVHR